MALLGYQFDKMRVDPSADALLYNYLNGNNNGVIPTYKDGMKVTASGLVLTILPGACIIEGRLIVLTEPQAVTVPIDSGKILALTVDLSKMNTATGDPIDSSYIVTNNQIKFELRDNVDASNQDLNNGGTVYSQPLGAYETQGTAATWYPNTRFYSPASNSALTSNLVKANLLYQYHATSMTDPLIPAHTGAANDPQFSSIFKKYEAMLSRQGSMCNLQFKGDLNGVTHPSFWRLFYLPGGFRYGLTADHFSTTCGDIVSTGTPVEWTIYQSSYNVMIMGNSNGKSGYSIGFNMSWATNDAFPDDSLIVQDYSSIAGLPWPLHV